MPATEERHNNHMFQIDSTVQYDGPCADFASFTGSPLWGYGVDGVIERAEAKGWRVERRERLNTPYGLSPLVVHFVAPSGRDVIWIPSYGEVVGEDSLFHLNFKKCFWVLWKAGVKVMLVGGTSGIADWRQGDVAIRPGDVVLPWSFYTRPVHRGLPGTQFESMWSKCHFLLGQPFCPLLQTKMEARLTPFAKNGQIRGVRTPADTRVALVVPDSIAFETDFDILHWMSTAKTASDLQPDRPPIATLHGDCQNPLLARYLGIHVLYYNMVSNYAQGLEAEHDIRGTMLHLYTKTFPEIALTLELELLAGLEVPDGDGCLCTSSMTIAPPVFSQTLTQPE